MIHVRTRPAFGFALCAHRNQRRNYTGGRYVDHCVNVAERIAEYYPGNPSGIIDAALLHDVVEDTDVTLDEIARCFNRSTADLVEQVTDVSRPIDGPRARRKQIDREHLAESSNWGASIKLADLIDNARDVVAGDPKFARVYLGEKRALLEVLRHGDPALWGHALRVLERAEAELAAVNGTVGGKVG